MTRFLCSRAVLSCGLHCSQTDKERRSTEQSRVAQGLRILRKEILSRFGVSNRVETNPYPVALPGTHRLPSLISMSGPEKFSKEKWKTDWVEADMHHWLTLAMP